MTKEELRIVYMGTADFALAPLKKLVEGGYKVVAVVTGADKPSGRGMKLRANSIKTYAESVGLPVLQPLKLKDEAFVNELRSYEPDLGVVVAFRMLPEVVWQMPKFGTMNLHGSLLPKYRGAAPIHWAVINGEQETGVSCFLLKHEIDTGDVLSQAKTEITPEDTTGTVYERLMYLGADLLEETVAKLIAGELYAEEQEQMEEAPTHAPKLTKENTKLDYSQSAEALVNFVRGLNPFPTAWTELEIANLGQQTYKIHKAEAVMQETLSGDEPIGSVILIGRKSLEVVCGKGRLRILELQPQGKRTMSATDFLNGLKLD